MIETKLFELRDHSTFIPIICSQMRTFEDREEWLLERAGYSKYSPFLVLLARLDGGLKAATYDPYDHGDRTYKTAHKYIEKHWDKLESGQVIDVRAILGESKEPCVSEQLEGCP